MSTTLTATLTLSAQELRGGDVLHMKDGTTRLVTHAPTRNGRTWVEVMEDERPIPVDADYQVTVLGDRVCEDCGGTGQYRGRSGLGAKHFACTNGVETRADRVRNTAYWNLTGARTR